MWSVHVYPNYYKEKKIDKKSFEMHFLKEQFWRALMFWNVFLEGEIYLEFMVAD